MGSWGRGERENEGTYGSKHVCMCVTACMNKSTHGSKHVCMCATVCMNKSTHGSKHVCMCATMCMNENTFGSRHVCHSMNARQHIWQLECVQESAEG